MSHAKHGDHTVHHPEPLTGIDNRKLAFWLFLASECVFFASLIVGYLVNKSHVGNGPSAHDLYDIPTTTISTFVLLMSSLTMVLAVAASARGDIRGLKGWLLATITGGLIFLGFQYYEFSHFIEKGLTLSSSGLGSGFYTLTGFHGAHVAGGVLWLISLLIHAIKGGQKKETALDVEIAGLYWHFVDVVWIVIFTVVYLVDAVGR